jgi:hypothetical protein
MCRIAQKHLLVACALILGISAAPAEAQVQSTMVLKNGTRHTGNNLGYRIDGREVSMRVSFSEQPRIPVDQVAYVDYGGTPDVDPNLSGSEQAVVLRDGSILKGQIIEIGHQDKEMKAESYIVIIRTSAGEERRLPVNQVARVYFSNPAGATGGSSGSAGSSQVPDGTGVAVVAERPWTSTGLTVQRGEVLTFNASGEAQMGNGETARPSGSGTDRKIQNAPLPQVPPGALIARVGNGAPFPIGGPTATVTMPAAGQLFLGLNDDHHGDNSGGFRVEIQRVRNPR